MAVLKLAGGRVVDPANQIDEVRDLWIQDGVLVAEPTTGPAPRVLNLQGAVVMPGGVDMHCHIAGPKVNQARKLQPELFREGDSHLPTSLSTGHQYTTLGYTTCFDAAVSPLAARQIHHEFRDIPNVDAGFFVLVGNNHHVLEAIADRQPERLQALLGWLMNRTGAYAPKIVNPGGVELWKQSRDGNARDLDQTIDGFNVTPRQILQELTRAGNALGLPHPVHIHTNNLGMPGNWTTTLETFRSLAGMRAHCTHIQFHSYGRGGELETDAEVALTSQVQPLAEYVNQHPELTVDVGQVLFGRTTSMTGDAPLGYYLHQLNGNKWYSADIELESGCGISPINYRQKNYVHAMQWAIGLEWYLLVQNPWQVAMSTDHPNGGSFRAYPQIIRLLMDPAYRRERVAELPRRARAMTVLNELDRAYSLSEIAVITRAGPARILGLKNKGHLGVGADADVTVYQPDANYETMFSLPRWVIKGGELIIDDFQVQPNRSGMLVYREVQYDTNHDRAIEDWFDRHYSINSRNFGAVDLISAHPSRS